MSITIRATAQLPKTFRVAREKLDDDTEQVIAHLRVADIMLDRDQLDELCGQPIGWSAGALFDDFGAPRARLSIALNRNDLTLSGIIDGGKRPADAVLRLKDAGMSGIGLELTKLGALLSCQLSWRAAGDEVDDIAEMLGRLCNFAAVIQDGGQSDLVDAVRGLQRQADETGVVTEIATSGGSITFAPAAGRITSSSEAMRLIESGYHLRGAEPDYWLERPDGSDKHSVWLNAARACLKRGLEPIGDDQAGDEVGRWKHREVAA